MEIFNCRSPFILDVNGASNQIKTKIELFIWRLDETQPTTPTKVIEKVKYSLTQYVNFYNISPFVYDYINNTDINLSIYNVQVKKYYFVSGDTDYSYIDTIDYISLAGYNDYLLQNYFYYLNGALTLIDVNVNPKINYFRSGYYGTMPTIDLVFDFTYSNSYRIKIENVDAGYSYNTYFNAADYSYDLISMRYQMTNTAVETENGNDFIIEYYDGASYQEIVRYTLVPICENKYTPFTLDFVNSLGGLQKITLFKNSTQTIEVKGSDYNTNAFTLGYPSYDTAVGQKRILNKNGTRTIKCNTGWISEKENQNIKDIMLSEYLSLTTLDNSILSAGLGTVSYAVTLKNTSMQMKTHLNEKVINYELEFEVASKLINNIV